MSALHVIDEPQASKITHAIVVVTPEMAKRWLNQNNTRNRDIRESKWRKYANEMVAGLWHFNGETIQFDNDGNLLNGQHRLTAIARTGLQQTFLVVRGLDPATQVTMDQGERRNPLDQLRIVGADVSDTTAAAALRFYMTWTQGRLFGDALVNKITTVELVKFAQDNPDVTALLSQINVTPYRGRSCRPGASVGIALGLAIVDRTDCYEFFAQLNSLDGISSPVVALRNRLDRSRTTQTKLTDRDLVGFFTIAWNAFRDGRDLSKLQRPKGNAWLAETFPDPK